MVTTVGYQVCYGSSFPYHLKQESLLDSEKSEALTAESRVAKDDLCGINGG